MEIAKNKYKFFVELKSLFAMDHMKGHSLSLLDLLLSNNVKKFNYVDVSLQKINHFVMEKHANHYRDELFICYKK